MTNSTVNFTSVASTDSANNISITSLDMFVYFINILFGFPTHSYVIWLMVKGTKSGAASEFFYLNLSLCEIGICLSSVLSVINYYIRSSNYISLAVLFFLGLTITGRALFQCLICVERYLAVVHPVTFVKYKPLRYRVICCAAAWILTLGSCFCCLFHTDQFYPYVYNYFSSIQFLLFLSIQLFCLVAVLRALNQSGPGERRREEENQMKRRAFFIILITTVAMSVIYIPCIISAFTFIVTKRFIVEIFSFGFLCFILASFVQPVLYLHRSGKLSLLCSLLNIHV